MVSHVAAQAARASTGSARTGNISPSDSDSVESVGSGRRLGQSSLLSGIPATLQDALMARLDRLGPVKEVAQLGATLGREFSYELMQAVCPLDEVTLQHGLKQLVKGRSRAR